MYDGELVRLRELRESDIDEMLSHFNSIELREFMGVPVPWSRQRMQLWMEKASTANPWRDGMLVLAIEVLSTGEFLGITRLEDIKKPHSRAELGVSIYDPAKRDRGFGSDATRVMVWVAFNILGLHSVYLDTMEDNERSIHVYEKIGFKRVGVLRETEFLNGGYKGLLIMDILREDFEAHNPEFSAFGKV
ncbi:MAG: GNAT family N-acetyltransferase [Candidatus Thorarchaeota archaeon]